MAHDVNTRGTRLALGDDAPGAASAEGLRATGNGDAAPLMAAGKDSGGHQHQHPHEYDSGQHLPALLVRNRNFVLLWGAYGVAAIGDHLSEMALLKNRGGMTRPDATRVQALITFGFFLPFVLLGPVAGWWSDRFSRKYSMVAADLLRACVVFNLALIVGVLERVLEPDGQITATGDFAILIPLALIGSLAAFFSPARQAMLPTLIRDNQLVRANAMINALGTIGTIIAALLGGYLVQHVGPTWNFHINAMTFLASALLVGSIAMSRTRAVPHPPLEGMLKPIKEGFRYVRQHRRVFQLIWLGTAFWAAAGVIISVVPAIVKAYFGDNYAAAGTFRGIMALGLASGATVMTIVGSALPIQTAVITALLSAGFWAFALDAAHAFQLGTVVTGICLFGIGGAGAALLVTIMASMQHFVPDSKRGRVFGVADMSTMGAMVLATGALGLPEIANLDRFIPLLLAVVGVGFWAMAIMAWRNFQRSSPHPPVLSVIWRITTFYARFWLRTKRVGPCTIPRKGPVILAVNHTAGIDPVVVYATCNYRIISFLVEQDYYNVPVAKWLQQQVGCIPINRKAPSKSTLATILRLLQEGGCLGIFPAGRFETPGEPVDVKAGVGMFALRTGATVIPCHISGIRYFNSVAASFMHRHDVRVRYGKPVDLSAFAGRERDKAAQDEASELIMSKIRELAPPVEETVAGLREAPVA